MNVLAGNYSIKFILIVTMVTSKSEDDHTDMLDHALTLFTPVDESGFDKNLLNPAFPFLSMPTNKQRTNSNKCLSF